ncbi:MAG: hypothetical protein FD122_1701 [Stygiobacter sp.]|nr:MAG: hypothetical protein FD122_1701 [Stygiobacter sp.]KAF0215338.1 MAG: hypothetical protein FD178_1783 [Ignavibacteria bacterium]
MDYLLPFSIILIVTTSTIILFYFGFTLWSKKRKFIKSIEKQRESLRFEKEHDKAELIKRALVLIKND